jgi:hypothetical protein
VWLAGVVPAAEAHFVRPQYRSEEVEACGLESASYA